jgi:UDP-3-O-[3-hydroxymyristoyl] glucosamine N-acyltransferase
MTEPFFFPQPTGLTLGEIVTLTGAEPAAKGDLERRVTDIAPLDRAGPHDLTFFDNKKFQPQLAATHAAACLASTRIAAKAPPKTALLRCREPYRAFVAVARALFPAALRPSSLFEAEGVMTGATVHPAARLEQGVTVDPAAIIGPRAEIGAGTVVGAGAVIGAGVRIGRDCAIGAGATISNALIGDRVIVHPGCRIGQDGFGFVMGPDGHLKVPQVGRVIIQNDVEIGANSTIDRGALRDTVIGEGTKIDNLVQIGHNVSIGRHCVIVAQSGLAGSVTVEDFVALGAKAGAKDHVTIGEGAQIAAMGNVGADVPPGARWGGTPAKPMTQWIRELKLIERMATRRTDAEQHGSGQAKTGKGD